MPEQIRDFAMSQLSVAACALYHELVIEQIKKATPAALHIEDKMEAYEGVSGKLDYIVNRLKGFVVTPELRAADDVRDRAAGVICSTVTSQLTSTVEAKQKAAARLNQKINIGGYRGIRSHEMLKETKEIKGMLRMLDEEESQADVETLGLKDEVESMRSANALFLQYIDEKADESNVMLLQSDIKTDAVLNEANHLYREIAQIVNAYAIVQPSEAITQFISKVNGLARIHANTADSGVSDKPVTTDPDGSDVKPTTPEITKFYPKEGANPDKPLEFPRNKTAVLEGKGLKLVDSPEGKKAQLVLINYVDQRMPHEDSAILLNTDEKIEFTMMYDAAEGQYNFQIETYPNGTEEAVIIKYPETITLV